MGPGQVVSTHLKETMRTFIDVQRNSSNANFVKPAKKFYDQIESRLIHKHTLDIWAFGLDQYGLVEMKDLANKSGGSIIMHELFSHFIFNKTYVMHYEAN